jgi:hypothetical protein
MHEHNFADELVSALSVNCIASWSPRNLGVSDDDFSRIATRILELEQQGVVDVLSVSRVARHGSPHASAIKFMRIQPEY